MAGSCPHQLQFTCLPPTGFPQEVRACPGQDAHTQGSSGEKGPPSTHFPQSSVPYRSTGLQSCCAEGGPLSPWGPLDWRGPCTGSVSDQWPHLPPAACLCPEPALPGNSFLEQLYLGYHLIHRSCWKACSASDRSVPGQGLWLQQEPTAGRIRGARSGEFQLCC